MDNCKIIARSWRNNISNIVYINEAGNGFLDVEINEIVTTVSKNHIEPMIDGLRNEIMAARATDEDAVFSIETIGDINEFEAAQMKNYDDTAMFAEGPTYFSATKTNKAIKDRIKRFKNALNHTQTPANGKSVTVFFKGALHEKYSSVSRGHWKAMLVYGTKITRISGDDRETTTNKIELTALLNALRNIKHDYNVCLYTNNDFILSVYQWMKLWKKRNWTTKAGDPIKNKDLWIAIADEMDKFKSCRIEAAYGDPIMSDIEESTEHYAKWH